MFEPGEQRRQFAAQPLACRRIERGERLVEQQQFRLSHHGAGERHALLFAAGKFLRPPRGQPGDAQPVQRLGHARFSFRRGQAMQAVADVFRDGQVRKQRVILRHKTRCSGFAAAKKCPPSF